MKRILLFILLLFSIVLIAVPAYAAEKQISAPDDLAVKYTDFEEIKISWDKVGGATGYCVLRREKSADKWKEIGDTKKTAFVDKKATNGKTFYYTVRPYAVSGGTKKLGQYDKTGIRIQSKIAAPKLVSAKYVDYKAIKLDWDSAAGADGYYVYRKEAGDKDWTRLAATTKTYYTDKKTTNSRTYYYTVKGYAQTKKGKVTGLYDKSGLACLSELPAPSSVCAESCGFCNVKVTWKASVAADGYQIYRKEKNAEKWTKIGTSATTEYYDKSAVENAEYRYQVRAYAKGAKSTIVSKYKSTPTIKAVSPAPKLAAAKAVGYRAIDIEWKAVTGAKNYHVLRKTYGSSKWTTIAKNVKGLTYRDTSAKHGVKYVYTVRAAASAGGKTILGKYNTTGKTVTAAFPVPTNLTAENTEYNKIRIKWDAVPGADGYKVYRRTSSSGDWTYCGKTAKTQYTNTVTCGTIYYYTVAGYAVEDGKTVSGKYDNEGIRKQAMPACPVVEKLPAEATEITLKWNAQNGIDGYYVYRKIAGGEWKKIAETTKTQYHDENAEIGVKYSYRVNAYHIRNGKKVVGGYRGIVSGKRIKHVHFRQGDDAWRFSRSLEKKACVLCSFSMILKNLGEDTNPRYVYAANGNDSGMEFDKALKYYGREYACALSKSSKYLSGYDEKSGWTYVKKPEKNAVAAIKEALKRNPEGVMCYFVKGNDMHGIVAIGYEGNTIYYSDPGRVYDKGYNVTFNNTWCKKGHNMGYKHLKFIMAVD